MEVSPLLSTPLSGVSLSSKWKFDSSVIMTPGTLDVRKKLVDLYGEDEDENENDSEQKQWSPTSEYFSQSVNEYSSGNSFSDGSPSTNQVWSNVIAVFVEVSNSPSFFIRLFFFLLACEQWLCDSTFLSLQASNCVSVTLRNPTIPTDHQEAASLFSYISNNS